jgi:glycerol-3-phosphate acyltransferase PlsY
MSESALFFIAVLLAYAVGSVPFGLLIAKFAAGIDIRRQGSGNIGATNVGRVLGSKWGVLVLLLDCLKGMLPVGLLPLLFLPETNAEHAKVACGMAAIAGHMYPCWLRFSGGKGVATALGAAIILAWIASACACVVFAVTFLVCRLVAASSMLAAVTFAVCQFWQMRPDPFASETWSLAAFSLLVPLMIILRHRANLVRLLRGQEPQFRPSRSGNSDPNSVGVLDGERAPDSAPDGKESAP